jgi:hypothetical protein
MRTVVYLYNRQPSCPLQLLTPYETLFLQPPNYSHLCTFVCLYFPNLSATSSNKLLPRSTACIFIGYPQEHKGYRCLDLSSNKVMTSRHVLFDELIFPLGFSAMQFYEATPVLTHTGSWCIILGSGAYSPMQPHHQSTSGSNRFHHLHNHRNAHAHQFFDA